MLGKTRNYIFLLLPALLVLLALGAYPIFRAAFISLHEWSLVAETHPFVGLQNYIRAFNDPQFLYSLRVTGIFVLGAVSVQTILGVGIGVLFRRNWPGFGTFRSLFFLPMLVAPIAVGLLWRFIYRPEIGIVDVILNALGFGTPTWLGDPRTVVGAVLATSIWQWTPFVVLLVLAGLSNIPEELYEAASLDGANGFQSFFRITLPLLKPTLVTAVMLRGIGAFKIFPRVFMLTRGGPGNMTRTVSYYIYNTGFKFFEMGYAAAMSIIMLILVVILTQTVIRTSRIKM